ncbi:hypothetical protein PWT90_02856 [Aphanocladium album]|nr:hypothetical protein PWT90_02856 [Aphanocladium album]
MIARIRGMLGFAVGRCQDHSPVVASCFGINDLATGKTLFSYYTGQILSALVQDIQKPDKYLEKQLIARLGMVIYDDIVMSAPSLRTHLNGFMAAISAVGGLAKAIADGHIRLGIVQIFLVTIVMTNTTSPSYDQMQTESDVSYSDIYSYYSCAVVAEVPCPTVLFVCITDINRLRARIAREEWEDGGGDGGGTAAVKKAANTILKHALAFQPGTWTERYKLPGLDIAHPIAAMFRHAVVLYGTRTLAGHAGIHVGEESRLAAARELLTAIKEATAKVGNFLGATWPLMVAGASLAGAAAEQEEVASLLNALTQQPNPSDGLWLGIECLRRFWASGKTGWDDCFSTWHTTVP